MRAGREAGGEIALEHAVAASGQCTRREVDGELDRAVAAIEASGREASAMAGDGAAAIAGLEALEVRDPCSYRIL